MSNIPNKLDKIKVTVIAPNNCSPDYRITKSFDMIMQLSDNAEIVRLADRNSKLNNIHSCHDIEVSTLSKTVSALSVNKFKTTFNFSVWFLAYLLHLMDQMAHVLRFLPARGSLKYVMRENNKSKNKILKNFSTTSEKKILSRVIRFKKMLSSAQKK